MRENDECALIALEDLPPAAQHLIDKGIPQFEPENRLCYIPMTVRVAVQSPLQLFLFLLGEAMTLQAIVVATMHMLN